MNRRVPLTRSSSLPPGSGPSRRTPLRAVSARREAAGQPRRRAQRDTGPSAKVRRLVVARDNWQCVGCGNPLRAGTWWSLQHRKARGVGGDNSPSNLVTLCGSATSQGCHRRCEDRDREMHARGLWLRSDEDPAMVPVMIASEHGSGVTAWLTEAGGYIFEAPAGAA